VPLAVEVSHLIHGSLAHTSLRLKPLSDRLRRFFHHTGHASGDIGTSNKCKWKHNIQRRNKRVASSKSSHNALVKSMFFVVTISLYPQAGYCQHERPHIGAIGVSWPPGKMDEKLKSENMQKRTAFYVYVIFWEQSQQAGDHIFTQIYFRSSEYSIS